MDGLHLLGAAEALSAQYITFRVKGIDRERLKRKVGGAAGTMASAGLYFADLAPRAAVDVVLPIVKSEMGAYGIDADVTVSNTPPAKGGRAFSEFWPGLAIGAGGLVIWKLMARLFARK